MHARTHTHVHTHKHTHTLTHTHTHTNTHTHAHTYTYTHTHPFTHTHTHTHTHIHTHTHTHTRSHTHTHTHTRTHTPVHTHTHSHTHTHTHVQCIFANFCCPSVFPLHRCVFYSFCSVTLLGTDEQETFGVAALHGRGSEHFPAVLQACKNKPRKQGDILGQPGRQQQHRFTLSPKQVPSLLCVCVRVCVRVHMSVCVCNCACACARVCTRMTNLAYTFFKYFDRYSSHPNATGHWQIYRAWRESLCLVSMTALAIQEVRLHGSSDAPYCYRCCLFWLRDACATNWLPFSSPCMTAKLLGVSSTKPRKQRHEPVTRNTLLENDVQL